MENGFAAPPEEAVLELAQQAGHVLLENGAEIFRVEETMERICSYYGVRSQSAFVMSNAIFMTAGDRQEKPFARVQQILVGRTNLARVTAVNQLSREIEEGNYSVDEARDRLETIKAMPEKKKSVRILASGVCSGAFCCLLGGSLADGAAAFAAGLLLYIYILELATPHLSRIVGTIGGSTLVTLFCGLVRLNGFGTHLNSMIIGSIMPLIPGVPFTNGIRDVANEDYLSGAVRMLDAMLVFFCIAIGVGFGISLLNIAAEGGLL